MSQVDLTLANPDKIAIQTSKSSENASQIHFELLSSSKNVGTYDLQLLEAPLLFSRKVRVLENDKVRI